MLYSHAFLFSPCQAEQLLWCLFVNTTGRPGKNTYTWKWIGKAEQTGVNGYHTVASADKDRDIIIIYFQAVIYIQILHLAQVQHTSHWDTSDDVEYDSCLPTALRIIMIFLFLHSPVHWAPSILFQ